MAVQGVCKEVARRGLWPRNYCTTGVQGVSTRVRQACTRLACFASTGCAMHTSYVSKGGSTIGVQRMCKRGVQRARHACTTCKHQEHTGMRE